MRLKERRGRVKSLLQHKPQSTVADGDLDRALVDATADVWTERAWTFAVREARVDVIPDITPETVGGTILATLLNDQRSVAFSAEIPDLRPDCDRQVRAGRTWVGQVLCVGDRDYRIQAISLSGGVTVVVLDEPIRLTDSVASELVTDWRFKWMEIPLPDDCSAVLALFDADTPALAGGSAGKIPGLPNRRAEEVDLRYDQTGTPQCWIAAPALEIPAAGRITAACVTSNNAVSDAFGFVAPNRSVELTWAYSKGEKIGPLAEPVVVEIDLTGATSAKITVALFAEDGITPALIDAPDYQNRPYPLANEGYRKVLFFNSNLDPVTGERKGIPCWREVTRRALRATENQGDGFPLEILDTGSTAEINQPHQVHPNNRRLPFDPDGRHQRIRLWPRPSDYSIAYPEYEYGPTSADPVARKELFKQLILRYVARPVTMAEAGDTDGLPTEFHIVTVHKAAAAFLRPLDSKLADKYEARARDGIAAIAGRYLEKPDVELRRQSWGETAGGWPNHMRVVRTTVP